MSGGRPSYAELFGRSREELLDALADGIERVHREKQKLEKQVKAGSKKSKKTKRSKKSETSEPTEQGDFLYDFVRMNIDYLNQMARLGSSYSVVAGRVLEKLYDRFAPRSDPADDDQPAPRAEKPRPGPSRRRRA